MWLNLLMDDYQFGYIIKLPHQKKTWMRLDPGDSTCFFGGGVGGFLAKLETENAKNRRF
jgi:hypothetical protein